MPVMGGRKAGVMPKETIHTLTQRGPTSGEVIDDDSGLWNIHVGWDGHGSVQVGIESADHRCLIDILVGDAIDRETLDKLLGDGQLPAFTGLWGSLDRDKVNELIRVLRKARDRSFGRDE